MVALARLLLLSTGTIAAGPSSYQQCLPVRAAVARLFLRACWVELDHKRSACPLLVVGLCPRCAEASWSTTCVDLLALFGGEWFGVARPTCPSSHLRLVLHLCSARGVHDSQTSAGQHPLQSGHGGDTKLCIGDQPRDCSLAVPKVVLRSELATQLHNK